MTSEQRIDAALDSVLKAAGSSLKIFTVHLDPARVPLMREAMRKVMSESYIKGSNKAIELMRTNINHDEK